MQMRIQPFEPGGDLPPYRRNRAIAGYRTAVTAQQRNDSLLQQRTDIGEMLGQRNRLGFADGIETGAHRKRDDLLPAARECVIRSVLAPKIAQLLRVAEKQRLYVKLSAPYRMGGGDARPYAALYLARLGAERLMWGSDWPWAQHEGLYSYAQTLGWLNEWIADENARTVVLWDTPASLFGF